MTAEFVIRHATEEDVPEIMRIYNDAILSTTATFDTEPKTLEDRLDWFRERKAEHPVLVATIDERVVGWAEIRPYGTRKAYRYTVENAIYIDPTCQGEGIGSALVGKLVDIASQNGFHAILALIVAGNDSSVRLHERFGFEQVGVMREVGRKFGRWLDVLIFEKLLDAARPR